MPQMYVIDQALFGRIEPCCDSLADHQILLPESKSPSGKDVNFDWGIQCRNPVFAWISNTDVRRKEIGQPKARQRRVQLESAVPRLRSGRQI